MVYNLNESLGYSGGAATNKTAPQTTNYPTKTPYKEVIFRVFHYNNSFIIIIILIINSFSTSFITSINYIIILIIILLLIR